MLIVICVALGAIVGLLAVLVYRTRPRRPPVPRRPPDVQGPSQAEEDEARARVLRQMRA